MFSFSLSGFASQNLAYEYLVGSYILHIGIQRLYCVLSEKYYLLDGLNSGKNLYEQDLYETDL